MNTDDRQVLAARARDLRPQLAAQGVELLATTFVDNSGITRVKAVPIGKLETAAAWGIGASPCFDGFMFNDLPAMVAPDAPGPVGDLRLHPDLDRITVLAAQHGWAWAPADRYAQDGTPHPGDQRLLARGAVSRLAEAGYALRVAFEIEWVIGEQEEEFVPAAGGAGYGYARLAERAGYLRDVVAALTAQGVDVGQVHPEYARGQFELSVRAEDPVAAADTFVLARETIRAVTLQHGLRASFSPKVVADGVGNGGHVHFSLWHAERNLFAGGDGRFGLTTQAGAFTAGILRRLPALLAIGAPSVASYLRLIPQHWAGVYATWGLENREAAVRVVTGPPGSESWAANAEVKCFDQTANPYLVVAALIFAGLDGLTGGATLPEPVDVDPELLGPEERARRGIERLPGTLAESVAAFEDDEVFGAAFGSRLVSIIAGVRRGEIAALDGSTPEEIAAAIRWLH